MKRKWCSLTILGYTIFFLIHLFAFPTISQTDTIHQTYQQATSTVHVITIPSNSNYFITPEISRSGSLTTLENFAKQHNAVAAINGGYFDPNNTKTTSYIIQNRKLVADPRTNERLIDNQNLKPYLGKILNRGEFRTYICGNKTSYDITFHHSSIPPNCTLESAVGAGPQILPRDTSVAEGFVAYDRNDKVIRNAIGTTSPNARSAIAITGNGDIILAMVAQSPGKLGMSLSDLASFLADLGAVKAINLDGGSSSSLYYQGETFYGKIDKGGNPIIRPLKSVLLVNFR